MKNLSKIIFAILIFFCSCASPIPQPTAMLGPELVFNGTFEDSTWIPTPSGIEFYPYNTWMSNKCAPIDSACYDSWELSSGMANHISTRNSTMGLLQRINVAGGKTYRVSFDILSFVPLTPDTTIVLKPGELPGGYANAYLYLGNYGQGVSIDRTGSYSEDVYINPVTFSPDALLIIDSFNILSIDNISVKEVL